MGKGSGEKMDQRPRGKMETETVDSSNHVQPRQLDSDVSLSALYRVKGELVTQSEIIQARLRVINDQIITYLNKKEVKSGKD